MRFTEEKKRVEEEGIEPDVNRTRNLLIWSQTRYHCATDPRNVSPVCNYLSCVCDNSHNWLQTIYLAAIYKLFTCTFNYIIYLINYMICLINICK